MIRAHESLSTAGCIPVRVRTRVVQPMLAETYLADGWSAARQRNARSYRVVSMTFEPDPPQLAELRRIFRRTRHGALGVSVSIPLPPATGLEFVQQETFVGRLISAPVVRYLGRERISFEVELREDR